MPQAMFNVFEALSAWGKSLPAWQRLLLSKLVATVEPTDETIGQVFAEYLIDQKLAPADAERPTWDMALPELNDGEPSVTSTLTAMTGMSGVNALLTGETLTFGPKLTVIYGPNGAGKSGYARVLKSACFTRSKDTGIRGDVKLARNKQPKPGLLGKTRGQQNRLAGPGDLPVRVVAPTRGFRVVKGFGFPAQRD